MTKQIWLNLPVKNVARSLEFFTALGFKPTAHGNSDTSAGIMIGQHNFVLMLFKDDVLSAFGGLPIANASVNTEVVISLDAESGEEVDDWARKAEEAGGTIYGKPAENQGWMYGCGFADPDGHRWNVLYMDMEKMPKG